MKKYFALSLLLLFNSLLGAQDISVSSCIGCSIVQNAASSLAKRTTVNYFNGITCSDNSGAGRTDCQMTTPILATGFGTLGRIPIDQGNGTAVWADPLVQGTQADLSTGTANPVVIGGYDTAGSPAIHRATVLNTTPSGSEYALLTRVVGAQTSSVNMFNAVAATGTQTSSLVKLPSFIINGTLYYTFAGLSGTYTS